jgi:hypothetical protein
MDLDLERLLEHLHRVFAPTGAGAQHGEGDPPADL